MNLKNSTSLILIALVFFVGYFLGLQKMPKQKEKISTILTDITSLYHKIEVLSPKDGEVLKLDSKYTIRWKARGVSRVYLELETGEAKAAGPFAVLIADGIPAERGYYEWDIFKTWATKDIPPKRSCRIRIVDADDSNQFYDGAGVGFSEGFSIEK